ncbi:MAG: zf-TFIIB domain-containing protein [bacterium]
MPIKPSKNEQEYIARQEFERKKKIEHEKYQKMKQEEKEKLKELHYMKCPKCGSKLIEINYKGIAIDECSECLGVWLDNGELEQVANLNKTSLDKLFSIFSKES